MSCAADNLCMYFSISSGNEGATIPGRLNVANNVMPSRTRNGTKLMGGKARDRVAAVPNDRAKQLSLFNASPTFTPVTAQSLVVLLVVVSAGRPSLCAETVSIEFAVKYVPTYKSSIVPKGRVAANLCGCRIICFREDRTDAMRAHWPAAASTTALESLDQLFAEMHNTCRSIPVDHGHHRSHSDGCSQSCCCIDRQSARPFCHTALLS